MTVVLDTGALIALDRGRRDVWSRVRIAFRNNEEVRVPTGVIAQAWRNSNRQALLARSSKRCKEIPFGGSAARAAGRLYGQTGTSDVIDASVALTVAESELRDEVVLLTSDTRDLQALMSALDTDARIVEV